MKIESESEFSGEEINMTFGAFSCFSFISGNVLQVKMMLTVSHNQTFGSFENEVHKMDDIWSFNNY